MVFTNLFIKLKFIILIKNFTITAINLPQVYFEVTCSKGTYIRSLVRDFGEALDTGAYLAQLCRTHIGSYSLKEAYEIETLIKSLNIKDFDSLVSHFMRSAQIFGIA